MAHAVTGASAHGTMGGMTTAPPARIRLRPDAFTPDAIAAMGYKSQRELATAVGVAHSTLGRAVAGTSDPGEVLIASLMHETGRAFDALFEVVPA